jgi:tetratricopeptide (TPR) repeat protein
MVAVFACYGRVIHNSFIVYDDPEYITENQHVQAGLTWQTVKWAFTSYDASNWHPLTWLSHALDCSLFGPSPVGPHLMNVLLHALNAALLFLFLQYATGFRWRSLMVAALFALHPVNVESVAWAAERKNVLSMLFFLLTLYAYVWYTRGPNRQRYAAVLGLFALALLAKPQVITLPFVLLLLDYWPLGRTSIPGSRFLFPSSTISATRAGSDPSSTQDASPRSLSLSLSFLLREKAPLFLLCLVSAVVTMAAQTGALKDLAHYGALLRVETALISYVRYLRMAIWPTNLVAMYPHATHLYPVWQVGGAALLLLAITIVVLRERAKPYLAVGWFWFLGTLVPMIGLIQVGEQELADRYAYISFIGLFVMFIWLLGDWVAGWDKSYGKSARWLAVPAILWLLALGVLTYRQVGYWHDTEGFWRRTLALTNDNYVAHKGLGGLLYNEGKTEEALTHVRAVIAIRPQDAAANMILAEYEGNRGDTAESIKLYQIVASNAVNPMIRAKAYAALGYIYRRQGQPKQATDSLEMSLRAEPRQPTVLVQLGLIAQVDQNDARSAVQWFARAMQLQPTDVGMLLLGNALMEEGGHEKEANAALERAAQLSRNMDDAEKQAKALLGEK